MQWQTKHAKFTPSGNFEWESSGAKMKFGGAIVGV
jgi:hypothetical protein